MLLLCESVNLFFIRHIFLAYILYRLLFKYLRSIRFLQLLFSKPRAHKLIKSDSKYFYIVTEIDLFKIISVNK